jgi:hypothetical protein
MACIGEGPMKLDEIVESTALYSRHLREINLSAEPDCAVNCEG